MCFPFEELYCCAGNQARCFFEAVAVKELICRASDDKCRADNAPSVLCVALEIRSKKLAVVRHPPQSGWLDELGRLKGGRYESRRRAERA